MVVKPESALYWLRLTVPEDVLALIREMQHYLFYSISNFAPFGWIPYKSGAEISANSTYWEAKL